MVNSVATLTERLQEGLWRLVDAGMVNSAASISEMIGRTVTITTPAIELARLGRVSELVGGPEQQAVGIYLTMEGDLNGHCLIILPPPEACAIVDFLMGQDVGSTTEIGEIEQSALCELGNITFSFFLNAIADRTGCRLMPSPPATAVDMAGSLLDGVLAEASHGASEALVFHTHFVVDEQRVKGLFLVMPDLDSLEKLIGFATSL